MPAPKTVKFKIVHPDAKLPTRGSEKAAGLDIYAIEDFTVPPTRLVSDKAVAIGKYTTPTGLIPEIPEGMFGEIRPRSGHAFKQSITVFEGTIDEDYRGEMRILLFNFSSVPVRFKKGDRIAQFVIQPYAALEPVPAKELTDTSRGAGGFGHTGK